MTRFFTSDWHFGDELIRNVMPRPFKNTQKMDEAIIRCCNYRAKNDDVIFHLGDLISYKSDRGSKGTTDKPKDYLSKINAKVVLLEGNHDRNNKVKPDLQFLVTNICDYQYVTMSHYPSFYKESEMFNIRPHSIHVCGHVHKAWKYHYDSYNDILDVNVGIDNWYKGENVLIVSEVELYNFINKCLSDLKDKTHIQKQFIPTYERLRSKKDE